MDGQWHGRNQGLNAGEVTLDLDHEGTHFEGHAILFEDQPGFPSSLVSLVTRDLAPTQIFEKQPLNFIVPGGLTAHNWEQSKTTFPGLVLPATATIELTRDGDLIRAKWQTDIGTEGHADLYPSVCDRPSELRPVKEVTDWKTFKDYVLSTSQDGDIYRGQDVTKRLRTAFHRTRRSDLVRYLFADIPAAHRALTGRTKHIFNLMNSDENGAFLHLLQHHGFPTPLLDWSYSPFVAAFFAFNKARERLAGDEMVRIFRLRKRLWTRKLQFAVLAFARPHFSIIEPLSIENPRAIPQQALSSVTNIDDVESYIRSYEDADGVTYLEAFDLPASGRKEVLRELSLMGVTSGSLFPGIDGTCEDLKSRFFGQL